MALLVISTDFHLETASCRSLGVLWILDPHLRIMIHAEVDPVSIVLIRFYELEDILS